MQARVRFGFVAGSPLRRSCVSSARNAGESAIWLCRGQPSAEIVRVECAKCRRECDLSRSGTTLCRDRACRVREMQARVRVAPVRDNPLRGSCVSTARNAAEGRECDVPRSGTTLCGDRARRSGEMQARVGFAPIRDNPLRKSCVSTARNAGESAICPGPGQPSAGIVRVDCTKYRRECDLSRSRATLCASSARNAGESALTARSGATLCGDRACRVREMQVKGRFGLVALHCWRKSRTQRSFWRLGASRLEEVS